MLYVHNRVLDTFSTRTVDEVVKFAEGFRPFEKDDPEFIHQLYRRGELAKKVEEARKGHSTHDVDWSFL